jgi:hypothetical protein
MIMQAVCRMAQQQQSATCANSSSFTAGSKPVLSELNVNCIGLGCGELVHSLLLSSAQQEHSAAALSLGTVYMGPVHAAHCS